MERDLAPEREGLEDATGHFRDSDTRWAGKGFVSTQVASTDAVVCTLDSDAMPVRKISAR